jgi:protein-S-isoprenylcysteine O-methyltransferase Ste14
MPTSAEGTFAMAFRPPSLGTILVVVLSTGLLFALPVWAWGNLNGFFNHPARAGTYLVTLLACLALLVSGANLGGGARIDGRTAWILLLVTAVSAVMFCLPSYADRREIATFDGDLARYTGLALFVLGCSLRVGPMFALGPRFRPPWTTQQDHRLVTTGFYRYIRNPSYLGAFLGMMGWFLVFRCGLGFLLSLLLIPLAIPFIRKEEAMLQEEFGDEYTTYKERTWRLIPFIN